MADAIGPGMWARVHYELRDGRGNLLESTEEPVEFVHGYGGLVPGLEAALEGATAGEAFTVSVPPEEAYGTRDETEVFAVERSEFPTDSALEQGGEFVAEGPDGTAMTLRIVEVHEEHVVVDANHPLAGETLNFQVRVLQVRMATEDEKLTAQAEASEMALPEGEPS